MKRDADDVRKIDGKFTFGWNIAQMVTILLIGVAVAGVVMGSFPMLYGSFSVMLVMAIVARVIRRKQRRLQKEGKL